MLLFGVSDDANHFFLRNEKPYGIKQEIGLMKQMA